MLVRSYAALAATLLLSVLPGACSKRDLVVGDTGIGLIDGGPLDTGTSDAPVGGTDGPIMQPPPLDAGASTCVWTTVLLPWMDSSSTAAMRLDVATTTNGIAVMNRQASLLDVRTYTRDGAVIGGFQFAADTQFLSSRENFLLVTRGQSGDLVATAIAPNLVGSTRLYAASSSATEQIVAAIALPTTVIVMTTEHFVNLATMKTVPWSSVFPGEMSPFKTSLPYGLATDGARVLVAWGEQNNLRLAVFDVAGTLIAQAQEVNFLGYLGSQTTTAIPYDNGLLLFDGNNVRATKIAFDLTHTVLGPNTQLKTFYRTAPRVAAIVLLGRPIAFWLTVFPATDNTQGSTPHQLYGCELNLADPGTCLSTSLIASTGLGGYGIAQEPVAAAALPDGSGFAIAHTDMGGYSWLNVGDLDCADRLSRP